LIYHQSLTDIFSQILSNEGVPTPVDALASNGLISSAITSFKISRLADQLNDGEVTFGGLDSSKFDANTLVTILNVSKLGFWEGAMDAITVNGQDSGMTGRTAILDTGTTLIIAPAADTQAVITAYAVVFSSGSQVHLTRAAWLGVLALGCSTSMGIIFLKLFSYLHDISEVSDNLIICLHTLPLHLISVPFSPSNRLSNG
jgi:hypothetical protein